MRHNIALIPADPNNYKPYIRSAQENFGPGYKNYLLGMSSIPHITLCQFDDDGRFKGSAGQDKLLQIVNRLGLEFINHVYYPTFIGLNFLRLKDDFTGLFSVELLVEREIRLVDLHQSVTTMVNGMGFEVLNSHGVMYRPHLTLACIAPPFKLSVPQFPGNLLGTSDFPFVVRLGEADGHWQFVQVMTGQ